MCRILHYELHAVGGQGQAYQGCAGLPTAQTDTLLPSLMRSGSLREFVCGSTLSRPRLARAKGLPSFRMSELEIAIVLSWLRALGKSRFQELGLPALVVQGRQTRTFAFMRGLLYQNSGDLALIAINDITFSSGMPGSQQLGRWWAAVPGAFRASFCLVFFWLALRTLTFWGFYMNYNKEAKSLTFRRGSEVSQVCFSSGHLHLRKAGGGFLWQGVHRPLPSAPCLCRACFYKNSRTAVMTVDGRTITQCSGLTMPN